MTEPVSADLANHISLAPCLVRTVLKRLAPRGVVGFIMAVNFSQLTTSANAAPQSSERDRQTQFRFADLPEDMQRAVLDQLESPKDVLALTSVDRSRRALASAPLLRRHIEAGYTSVPTLPRDVNALRDSWCNSLRAEDNLAMAAAQQPALLATLPRAHGAEWCPSFAQDGRILLFPPDSSPRRLVNGLDCLDGLDCQDVSFAAGADRLLTRSSDGSSATVWDFDPRARPHHRRRASPRARKQGIARIRKPIE